MVGDFSSGLQIRCVGSRERFIVFLSIGENEAEKSRGWEWSQRSWASVCPLAQLSHGGASRRVEMPRNSKLQLKFLGAHSCLDTNSYANRARVEQG